ncbi:hypothetical protein RRG08_058486 [Elysia crispata]|uniref:Uncharacterized protein n=1 Tax=Elysia crispata TaxID=231223 RepID=A0AAE0Y6N5_9GAST|nr:hypothetical protein RRG08_058486 [Elysia crispata]
MLTPLHDNSREMEAQSYPSRDTFRDIEQRRNNCNDWKLNDSKQRRGRRKKLVYHLPGTLSKSIHRPDIVLPDVNRARPLIRALLTTAGLCVDNGPGTCGFTPHRKRT